MNHYKLLFEDFKRVFEFATSYYIEPTKNTTGRTSGEPRGLGAILDSFTIGKLAEIGVEKILTILNKEKKYLLDFDIKNNNKVKNEPDIVAISENKLHRNPNIFTEIKNTSENDRWIGLTEDQFNTIKRSSKDKKIFMIYASINSSITNKNPKTVDLSGMFLKQIEDTSKSLIFQEFADLNAECKIEFILSSHDLEKFGYHFERGMNMYETNIFKLKNRSSFYSKDGLRKDVVKIEEFINFNDSMNLSIKKNVFAEKEDIGKFKIEGSFKLIDKRIKTFIECISDVKIENNIFGFFNLEKNNFYDFNLETLGRDPKLKRNNIFISKKHIYQLIEKKLIRNPEKILQEIAQEI
jgi:hypothetical protein